MTLPNGAPGPVRGALERMIANGDIRADAIQRDLAARLDALADELRQAPAAAPRRGLLATLFGAGRSPAGTEAPRGLYVVGKVGRGKTMLMDLFFRAAPGERKRRVHFNDFMADVHDRIGRHRGDLKAGRATGDDPIPPVAAAIAAEARLLCFDEFTVTDIADAMVLSRLFTALFEHGLVLVATSNVVPDDLYRDGLNRDLFLPFVATLRRHADVFELDGPLDYRMEKLSRLPVYLSPLGPEADRQMDAAWAAICEGQRESATAVEVMGRRIAVRRACGRAARFRFAELCEEPLAARDYLALAERFDRVLVDDVPVLDESLRSATKRFILLIDTLYDRRRRLVLSAAARPDALYAGRPRTTEAFEFDRTVSRLVEMQSEGWPDASQG